MQTNNVGIAGEFRCVVTKEDGTIKEDTGFQKNLILNQGLDFFGGNHGEIINEMCAIGSGNSAPVVTQTGLDAFIALTSGDDKVSDYSYVDRGDNLYRMWEQNRYRFTGIDNVNISEVGLVSAGSSSSNYYLTTRALIKDAAGNPTTITVKSDETLDIYYKIHKVIDVSDKTFVVNMLDGDGGSVPYNVTCRPIGVGKARYHSLASIILRKINYSASAFKLISELLPITSSITSANLPHSIAKISEYVSSTYKRTVTFNFGLNYASSGVRGISLEESRLYGFPYQIVFGSVEGDAAIPKNSKSTLEIPFEVSWGRYEGEL